MQTMRTDTENSGNAFLEFADKLSEAGIEISDTIGLIEHLTESMYDMD